MGIQVTGKEQKLENQHVGGPDGRGAAKPPKNVLADDELHLEEEKSAEEDGGGKNPAGALRRRRCGGILRLGNWFDDETHAGFRFGAFRADQDEKVWHEGEGGQSSCVTGRCAQQEPGPDR